MPGRTASVSRIALTTGAALAVFCGVLAAGSALSDGSAADAPAVSGDVSAGASGQGKPSFAVVPAKAMPESEPVRLDIPAIGVKGAPIDPVGLNSDRTVEVPPLERPELVGWYRHRATPGEKGPAVLLGHVDAYGEPAVFSRAHALKRGDTIKVKREDGKVAAFTVDGVERVDKDEFPTAKVYGETGVPELRLVTCGGAFDPATGHYEDNVIVYAHLAA
ncbi:class F sortase [Planomonospora venezuelensis]|uniref:LPXTG-site transpeptidase (Sortase) family protein n=1 Tax=Planomonospora venezuelensis TaxID=1999 RepID=A0A841D122_PLAVE|nr:class F sortase [Planomonospora venezuelensis]MBB5962007.1 LPXTG-site transpeptidase (sortase) family protein [Planomonospora venezuelensis]GIN00107.1 class F sortase [Planomonospora venezuelensis]